MVNIIMKICVLIIMSLCVYYIICVISDIIKRLRTSKRNKTVNLKCDIGDMIYFIVYDKTYKMDSQTVKRITVTMYSNDVLKEYSTKDYCVTDKGYNDVWFTDYELALKRFEEFSA